MSIKSKDVALTPLEISKSGSDKFLTGLTKAGIRSKILKELKIQKEEDRERKSKQIKQKLFGLSVFKKAKIMMFYISFGGEVNTKEMIEEAQKLGKIVTVPISTGTRLMRPAIFKSRARLLKGPYGVWEPAIKKSIPLKNLNLIIVPGLAFNKKGNRLGRGKGCYDCFLSKLPKKTPSIGLAFDFQILPFIPTTSTDVSVDRVIFA